jgi:hypothetical protein
LPKTSVWLITAWIIVALAFGAGVFHLFKLRFEGGDVYPVYSSLRGDPLGTRVFYDSLRRHGGLDVRRNFAPLQRVRFAPETTLFYLGAPYSEADSHSTDFIKIFDRLTDAGGRLVMTFFPQQGGPALNAGADSCGLEDDPNPAAVRNSSPGGRNGSETGEKRVKDAVAPGPGKRISVRGHWGIDAETLPQTCSGTHFGVGREAAAVADWPQLTPRIPWHSALYFKPTSGAWRTIYARGDFPVAIERDYLNGTLVLVSDSFFISNEGLHNQAPAGFLACLIGDNRTIVIDESHLGLQRRPGLVDLMRRLRLHWFFLPLVVTGLLFVWRNSTPFLPPTRSDRRETVHMRTADREEGDSLTGLLRGYLPRKSLLENCVRQWEASLQFQPPVAERLRRRIREVVGTQRRGTVAAVDPVEGYRSIYLLLAKDKSHE